MNSCRCLRISSISKWILLVSPCLSITSHSNNEKPGSHPPPPHCLIVPFQRTRMAAPGCLPVPIVRVSDRDRAPSSPALNPPLGLSTLSKDPTPSPQSSRPVQQDPVYNPVLASPCPLTAVLTKSIPPQGLCSCCSLACRALLPVLHLTGNSALSSYTEALVRLPSSPMLTNPPHPGLGHCVGLSPSPNRLEASWGPWKHSSGPSAFTLPIHTSPKPQPGLRGWERLFLFYRIGD